MKNNKHWFDKKSEQGQAEYVGKHPKTKFSIRRLLDSETSEVELKKREDIEELMSALNDFETKKVKVTANFIQLHEFFFEKWLKTQKDKNQKREDFQLTQMLGEMGKVLSNDKSDCVITKAEGSDFFNFKININKTPRQAPEIKKSEDELKNFINLPEVKSLSGNSFKFLLELYSMTDDNGEIESFYISDYVSNSGDGDVSGRNTLPRFIKEYEEKGILVKEGKKISFKKGLKEKKVVVEVKETSNPKIDVLEMLKNPKIRGLSPGCFKAYLVLIDKAGDSKEIRKFSVRGQAKEWGFDKGLQLSDNKNTVSNYLKELEQLGLIDVNFESRSLKIKKLV